MRAEPGTEKGIGIALAAAIVAAAWLAFWGADVIAHHRPAVLQAAKLGTLEWKQDGWTVALAACSALAYLAILAAWGVGQDSVIRPVWRWAAVLAAVLISLAPTAAYLATVGRSASYANGQEYGRVTPTGVIHYPWATASSAEISCRMRGDPPTHGELTFKVAFPDGQGEDFSFWFAEGDPGLMLDWDLWVAYQVRKAHFDDPKHKPKPVITSDPDCDAYIAARTPADIQAKFSQLFAPVRP